MFSIDALSCQSPIGFFLLRRQGALLAPLDRYLAVRMKFRDANVAFVGQTQGLGSKAYAASLEETEIVHAPWPKGRGEDDFAFPVHDYLGFLRVSLFLAAVVPTLLFWAVRSAAPWHRR